MKNHLLELLATNNTGSTIYYDSVNSHAATHFKDAPELKDLVKGILMELELHNQEFVGHIDMKQVVGTMDVVETDDTDEIIYAIRENRGNDGLVPFTKSRKGNPCQYVSLHLIPKGEHSYELSSAWIGTFSKDDAPFPESPRANEHSINFWSRHAFVYGSQEIIPGTETTVRPW